MKEGVRKALHQGNYVSGQEVADALGISRSTVWEYVKQLRWDGYEIYSSSNKGYCLLSVPDKLFPVEIKEDLGTDILGKGVIYYNEVESTQDIAKALASQGAIEGTTVICERQLKGRGRLGRSWSSPPGGIYLSVILRPGVEPSQILAFPLITGVAVAQAIEKLTSLRPRLKWPNDIIVNDKKTGGILTEMSAETDLTSYVITGIGINVNTDRAYLPEEIRGTATSLKEESDEEISRLKLVQYILMELELLYKDFKVSGFQFIRERWKELSNTIGVPVSVSRGKGELKGKAIDIDRDGSLILQKGDGSLERVVAGDVSLRNL